MCALFRAARKFDFAVGRKARCVCVCVCVCGGEGKSDVSPVGRKENRTRRAPLASISVNRQTLESSARVFARECASVRVRGENIPVKEDRKGCVDPKQPGCAGSTPPSMAGVIANELESEATSMVPVSRTVIIRTSQTDSAPVRCTLG